MQYSFIIIIIDILISKSNFGCTKWSAGLSHLDCFGCTKWSAGLSHLDCFGCVEWAASLSDRTLWPSCVGGVFIERCHLHNRPRPYSEGVAAPPGGHWWKHWPWCRSDISRPCTRWWLDCVCQSVRRHSLSVYWLTCVSKRY